MSYSPEHKAATRRRILAAAGRLFRKHGYEGVSVDRLMKGAGLTRGGFYAHFDSKVDLFAAVIKEGGGLRDMVRRARTGQLGPQIGPAQVMGYYLDWKNRKEIRAACPMATLASDVRRVGGSPAAAFAALFADVVSELARVTGDRETAAVAASTSVGAVTLAGALGDSAAARDVLDSARKRILLLLDETATARQRYL